MSISFHQLRAARSLLDISQGVVASAVGMSAPQLSNYESGVKTAKVETLAKLEDFYKLKGLEFTDNDGVKRSSPIVILEGTEGFRLFMDDVYETARDVGGDICVSNVNERNWIKWMGDSSYQEHSSRMNQLSNFNFKIFVEEGDDFYIASRFAEYKSIPTEFFNQQSYYAYGEKLALLEFSDDNVHINIIQNPEWALSFKRFFNFIWSTTS